VSHYGQTVSRTDAISNFSLPSHFLWKLTYFCEQLNDLLSKPISFAIVACQKINSFFSIVTLILSHFYQTYASVVQEHRYFSRQQKQKNIIGPTSWLKQVGQSFDLQTMVSRLECTRVHFVQVSVSVSRPEKVLTTTLLNVVMPYCQLLFFKYLNRFLKNTRWICWDLQNFKLDSISTTQAK